jgi:fluoride exporter
VSWPVWIGVAVLGGSGALARFGLTLLVADRLHPHLPTGTLAVNVSGAFLLLGAGALGSYTTFSTLMLETQRIDEAGKRRIAVTNVVLSVALGLAAAALGRALGRQL